MTIENESVFNSQTSPATPNPTNRSRMKGNAPYSSTGTRKRSTRKSLNFVRKKKVGGKLVEVKKTKNKDISELIDKIIIKNNKRTPAGGKHEKNQTTASTKPTTSEIREIQGDNQSKIKNEANRQAEKIQSILHKSTFKPKVDKFDLSKIQSKAGREQKQVIYKSLIKQPFFDKIVDKEYYQSKSSRRKSFACLSDIDSSLITGAIEKVDYKDFGHYVEDCKKHYALAESLDRHRKTRGGGPVTNVQVKLNRGKKFKNWQGLTFDRFQRKIEEIASLGFG